MTSISLAADWVVNDKEAKYVREIFELYRRHRSLDSVVEKLAGWVGARNPGSQSAGSITRADSLPQDP
jgi:hypothetical protein